MLRKLDNRDLELGQNFSPRWNSFKDHAEQLQRDGFVFVENFLNDSDAEILRQNWPGSRYFVPISPNEDHKTSDKGHVCDVGKPLFDTKKSPYMWKLFQMFLDESFTSEVSALCADGIKRYPYHMLAQNSYWGSGLTPHRDSVDDKYTNKINFIFFLWMRMDLVGKLVGPRCFGRIILKIQFSCLPTSGILAFFIIPSLSYFMVFL